jgi:capsular exopolysaccharide synthesis family protein
MGRIAEALKKAERERRERIPCAPPMPDPPMPAPPTAADARPAAPPEPTRVERTQPVRTLSDSLSESLVAYYDPSSVVVEQYRSLRTRLLSMNPNDEHSVLAITSAVPKEGKSVTALNTGIILAEIQHLRVAVVDGDFRRSSLARLLHQPSSPGLADVLQGEAPYEAMIQPTPLPNLFFVAAGETRGRTATEMLASEGMPSTFRKLQAQFHYVIVDTPPATTVTDVGIIGQLCKAVIVVIRMNRTPGPVVRRAVRLLQVNNIPVAGCVLVGHSERNSRYGYYYGYYPYYRYYDYYYKEKK